MTETIHSQDFGHSQLEWRESGNAEGDVIVFLHGFPDSPSTWDHQIAHFSKNYFCLAPYARGTGQHAGGPEKTVHSVGSHVLDLLGLIKLKDPSAQRRIFCVGHDLGGPIAARFARLLGDRLGGLVLINSVSLSQMRQRLRRPAQLLKSWYIYPILFPGVSEAVLRFLPAKVVEAMQRKAGMPAELARESSGSLRQVAHHIIEPLQQYRQYFREMWRDGDPVSERIDRPLLMLFGNHDPFLTLPTMDEARLLGHDAQVRIVEGAHWVHLDQAPDVNSFLDLFFEEAKLKP